MDEFKSHNGPPGLDLKAAPKSEKDAKQAEVKEWLGRPILRPEDHHDLETRAAIAEFHHKLPRGQAEAKAYADYKREHHAKAAAHHMLGIKAASASGDPKEAQKHSAMYMLHMKELGHNPYEAPPAEVLQHAAGADKSRIYRFKTHAADGMVLDGSKPKAPNEG